ncbi:hypothetical protein Pint_23827 [Pistacia integerrima]|uniref:Uncharacterized protein n=1 Tax=Pistacia integerrima TaxID=434235 RepID=A0ACC0YNB3_9ROSI|nr:hypothetical protein Pint_23827 [Pistacia integerrima]
MVLPETAIGALLSASLQVLFDRLASHQLLEFFRSRECDETLLHRLETALLSVLAVLSDAEEKQITNSIVKRWVNELKDAVYRAEDFLDEMFTNNLQRQMESESRGINKQVQSRNSRLKDIISRLEHVANTKDGLGLKESTLGANSFPRWPSTSLVDESKVFECKILDFLDDSRRYTELQTLHIIGCDSLESFPLGFFNKVAYLQIQKCSQLKYIEVSNDLHQVQELQFLGDLEVSDCSNLKHFTGGLLAPNLKSFSVSKCRSLELLPVLTSLETLALSDCRNLKSFRNDRLPPNLRSLFIMSCDHLTPKKNWGLNEMDSLTSLTITGVCSDLKSFPEKGVLPASLISLQVTKFPKLETLDLRGLQLLTSLRTLEINSCASLKDLSEGTLPSSLAYLIINECPLLKPKCQENGDYWEKINHIPTIEIF